MALEPLPSEFVARTPLLCESHRLRVSPITGVHLWFDRDVMADHFLTLLDIRTTQWIFNKSRLSAGPETAAIYSS